MAQFSQKRYDFFNPTNNDLYEVMMIANKNGLVVNSDNPFPVTMEVEALVVVLFLLSLGA